MNLQFETPIHVNGNGGGTEPFPHINNHWIFT